MYYCGSLHLLPPDLHRTRLTHTDLKPENILFVSSDFDVYYDVRKVVALCCVWGGREGQTDEWWEGGRVGGRGWEEVWLGGRERATEGGCGREEGWRRKHTRTKTHCSLLTGHLRAVAAKSSEVTGVGVCLISAAHTARERTVHAIG